MKIIEISLKLGATVNLGDYNNFRPEIGGKVAVEMTDDPDEVYLQLEEQLEERLARLVDDELERAGQEPRYATDLYSVLVSDVRRCVVVTRPHFVLPSDSNWRDKDEWSPVGYSLPKRMRYVTANELAIATAQEKDYLLNYVNEPADYSSLPGLPDPGPEPKWVTKGLRDGLERLNIPENAWERVGDLAHVDETYLASFHRWYHHVFPGHLSPARMVEMFVAGDTPWANAAASQADSADEEE